MGSAYRFYCKFLSLSTSVKLLDSILKFYRCTVYHKTANTSLVSYSSRVSNTSLGSETGVLIEARSQIKARFLA